MKSDFTYGALLAVHPAPGETSPFAVTCPSCGAALRVTARSRLFAAGLIIGSYIILVTLLWRSTYQLAAWQIVGLVLSILAMYYFVAWPFVVRFKPWSPFQYWLPKSRFVGYLIYLFVPLVIMASLLFLAIKLNL
jgi:hypothetical protein